MTIAGNTSEDLIAEELATEDRATEDSNRIAIACSADDSYAMPLAVTLRSALENLSGNKRIILFVLDGGIRPGHKQKILQSLISRHEIDVNWIQPQKTLLGKVPVSDKYPISAYYRILLPHLIAKQLKKLIYLDADLVVTGDIGQLWDLDTGDHHALAVQDICHQYVSKTGHLNRPEFGIPVDQKYFNTGVLLIDLEKWRSDCITEKTIAFLENYADCVLFADQDGLNITLAGKWGELDPRWNQIHEIHNYRFWQESPYSQTVYHQVLHHPYIIHFTTPPKPWMNNCNHPSRDLFFHYLDKTAWSGWRNTIFRRLLRRIKQKFQPVTFWGLKIQSKIQIFG